jgi:hypothetical protein
MVPVVRAFSARGGSTCNNLAESDAEASARRDRTLVSPFSCRADDDASVSATTADCTTRATQMSSWQCDSHTTCCEHYRGSCAGSYNLPEGANEVYLVRPYLARMGVPRCAAQATYTTRRRFAAITSRGPLRPRNKIADPISPGMQRLQQHARAGLQLVGPKRDPP